MLLSPVLKIDDDVEAKNMKYDMKENKIKERNKKVQPQKCTSYN